jgi:nucleoside-diphosphate-sugar epimerase
MRILITGNMGYVGPAVVRHLRARHPKAHLIGFDSAFFAHCLTDAITLPESQIDEQRFGDVREFPTELLEGVDAVVQLAAVSNDPMGNRFEQVTEEINRRSSIDIARAAQAAGVSHYVFASSCSVYGAGGTSARTERDEVNPLTAYARSKIGVERDLQEANLEGMTVTCLRFATACGMSPRLRLDLVLNDFVACAITSRKITVLSDGTPWRPLIDVKDMALAIDWAITREASNGGRFLVVNTGSDVWNYQVKELAEAVAKAVPDTEVSINTEAPPDKRSYQVDFSLFRSLAPDYTPRVTLEQSIAALREGLTAMRFADADFRNSQNMRLKVLEAHIANGRLMQDLRWAAAVN